jgi:hypothetical protein
MPASFSLEASIESALRDLNCSAASFAKVANASGTKVHESELSRALNGQKFLDREHASRLVDVLIQMRELERAVKKSFGVEINWQSTETISRALAFRRLQSIMQEVNDPCMDEFAANATQDVAQAGKQIGESNGSEAEAG